MKKYLKISGTSNKSGASQQKAPAKKGGKRKYIEDYVKFGFVASGSDDHQLPLCIICSLTLLNETLVSSKLSRHLKQIMNLPKISQKNTLRISYYKKIKKPNDLTSI